MLIRISEFISKWEEKISSASIIILIILTSTKLLGFVKLHLMTRVFGLSKELDIFWAAFTIPDFIFSLLIVGVVNASLLPAFIKIRKERGDNAVFELASKLISWMSILWLVLGIILYFTLPSISNFLFTSTQFTSKIGFADTLSFVNKYEDMFILLTRLMLFSPFLLSISSVFTALLQTYKKYSVASLPPFAYNLGIIFGMGLIIKTYPRLGIYSLAYSVILGSVFHIVVQTYALYKIGYTPRIMFKFCKDIEHIIRVSLPRILGLAIEQLAVLFNAFWSFTLGAGALSAFKLASSLSLMPVQIITGSVIQVVFPNLSGRAYNEDKTEFIDLYRKTLIFLIFLTVPIVVYITILRLPIVRFIYGAERFSWNATVITSLVLAFLTPSIIFQTLYSFNLRTFYCLNNTRRPLIISVVGVIANILFCILFTNFFSHYYDWRIWFKGLTSGSIPLSVQSLLDFLSWFFVKGKSAGAVAGLAFGLSLSSFIELLLSFKLLPNVNIFRDSEFRQRLKIILKNAFYTILISYASYRLFDRIFDTSRRLYITLIIVGTLLIGGGFYVIATNRIWRNWIDNLESLIGKSRFFGDISHFFIKIFNIKSQENGNSCN